MADDTPILRMDCHGINYKRMWRKSAEGTPRAEWGGGVSRHHDMGRVQNISDLSNQIAAHAGYSNAKTPYYICTG